MIPKVTDCTERMSYSGKFAEPLALTFCKESTRGQGALAQLSTGVDVGALTPPGLRSGHILVGRCGAAQPALCNLCWRPGYPVAVGQRQRIRPPEKLDRGRHPCYDICIPHVAGVLLRQTSL